MALVDYLRFIRLRYHVTFLSAATGALLFANNITPALLVKLALLYVSFNILLYGGIYTINDVADASSDAKHPLKRNRPLPSGRVGKSIALAFAAALTAAGLLSGFAFFSRNIFFVYLAILALNLFYTFIAKKIPYFELFVNSATHPLRFMIGILLVSSAVPYLLLLAIFALAFGFACVRRVVEKDAEGWKARETLEAYSANKLLMLQLLAFLLIIAAAAVDATTAKAYYAIVAAVYCILVFGIYFSDRIRKVFRHIWTR